MILTPLTVFFLSALDEKKTLIRHAWSVYMLSTGFLLPSLLNKSISLQLFHPSTIRCFIFGLCTNTTCYFLTNFICLCYLYLSCTLCMFYAMFGSLSLRLYCDGNHSWHTSMLIYLLHVYAIITTTYPCHAVCFGLVVLNHLGKSWSSCFIDFKLQLGRWSNIHISFVISIWYPLMSPLNAMCLTTQPCPSVFHVTASVLLIRAMLWCQLLFLFKEASCVNKKWECTDCVMISCNRSLHRKTLLSLDFLL